MGFRPRMQSSVKHIDPIHEVCCLQFDNMAVDYWRVEAKPGARGEYVSPDPRFVVFFDRATIALNREGQKDSALCNACFVPAGVSLNGRIEKTGYLEHIDIHVDLTQLERIVERQVDLGSPHFLSSSPELNRLSALLASECLLGERPVGYGEALTLTMIHEMIHLGMLQEEVPVRPEWLEQVMEYATENLASSLKVEKLADVADMSRSEFSKRFKELAGVPPHQWVMGARIKYAQQLLAEGVHLSHAALDAGFADQAHFSRSFRQATGLSPGRWVKRYVSTNADPILQYNLTTQQ